LVGFTWTYFIDNEKSMEGGSFNFSAKEMLRCAGCAELVELDEECYYCAKEDKVPDLYEVLVVPCTMCDLMIDAEDFPGHLDEEHFC